jgi:hypothetical protein
MLTNGDPTKLRFVMDELPMCQGFALIAWIVESNEWVRLERATPGYIAQEVNKVLNVEP